MAKKSKTILSWAPNWSKRGQGGRWKKQIDGKVRFFGHGKSRDDIKAYRAAERKYLEFLQEREATMPVEVKVSQATVADICEKFLQQLNARYQRAEVGATYLEKMRCNLEDFAQFVGKDLPFATITELATDEYRSHTLDCPVSPATGRPITLRYAKDRLSAVKTLYQWAFRLSICDQMPRNMLDYTKYRWPKTVVKTFTMQEVTTLWNAATGRLRCWIALALNCGYGQKDISDLRLTDIDWTNGYIERTRVKTEVKSKHKLWQITLDLLKKHKSASTSPDDLVFRTHKGHPLVRRSCTDGRAQMSDAVRNACWKVQRKTGIDGGRGFYCFRKTGSTLIEAIDPLATEMYLAHAETGMKRAYALRDWARLDRALIEMEKLVSGNRRVKRAHLGT